MWNLAGRSSREFGLCVFSGLSRSNQTPSSKKLRPTVTPRAQHRPRVGAIAMLNWKSPVTSYPLSEVEVCESEEADGGGGAARGGGAGRAGARVHAPERLSRPV